MVEEFPSTAPIKGLNSMSDKDAQFQYGWSPYETLEEAVKHATRRAQRDVEEQVIYKAFKVVKPQENLIPKVDVVDYVAE